MSQSNDPQAPSLVQAPARTALPASSAVHRYRAVRQATEAEAGNRPPREPRERDRERVPAAE